MRLYFKILFSIFCMLFFVSTSIAIERERRQETQAHQIWEQTIAAKGGRERLAAIQNAVITQRGELRIDLFKKTPTLLESLFVFPNKLWSWNDMRPSVFGLIIDMYDYDNHKFETLPPLIDPKEHTLTQPPRCGSLLNGLLHYFPETKWLIPVPINATVGKIGLRKVDIVQTKVNSCRVDFALDRKSHLPVRLSYYGEGKYQKSVTKIDLSDYKEVNEIKVPQTLKYDDGSIYNVEIQFNVDYDPELFTKPLSIKAGPKAWMKSK